jgi:hypothetical protein
MLSTVLAHLKSAKTSLNRAVFVLYQDETFRAFTDTLKRLGALK